MDCLTFNTPGTIVRANGNKVRFTAIVYYSADNPKTEAHIQPQGYYERIAPGAFDDVLSRSDADIVATIDHDLSVNGIIGRTPDTLEIFRTATGIDAEVTLPRSMSDRVGEMIERNELRGASFIAKPSKYYSSFSKEGDKRVMTIRKFDALREVSIVFKPYYEATEIKRSWCAEAEELFYQEQRTKELIEKIRNATR